MECPLCGELCTCTQDRGSSSARGREEVPSHVAVLIDPESLDTTESQDALEPLDASESSEPSHEASLSQAPEPAPEPAEVEVPLDEVAEVLASVAVAAPLVEAEAARAAAAVSQPPPAPGAPPVTAPPAPFCRPDDSTWRQEVSSRVDSFRTRRRGRFDPNASLSLDFDPAYEAEPPALTTPAEAPKVIEFPRPAAPPVVEELAEPVVEKPRILEAEEPLEEVAAPVAAAPVASITLEPAATEAAAAYGQEREVLLWLAPPAQRIFAGLVDALVVVTAAGLFGLIFLYMTGAVTSGRMAAGFALALPAFFWALYQYVFLVYGGTTPGLQMSGLRLTTFDGNPVPRRQRRWRALATMVSCLSLGLGFLWVLVDEDGLGWHDRITRTCVRE
jgi:uncharacterized RDD family membrane protein YckC